MCQSCMRGSKKRTRLVNLNKISDVILGFLYEILRISDEGISMEFQDLDRDFKCN